MCGIIVSDVASFFYKDFSKDNLYRECVPQTGTMLKQNYNIDKKLFYTAKSCFTRLLKIVAAPGWSILR